MNSTYAQKSSTVQKAADAKAASVLDSSAQSESLQRKADMANNAAQRAEAPRPNNTGMPDNLKSGIESLSGFSMDDVRVHYNSSKPATVQALAYTQGTDIHVAPGQEKCLPHEAWHVAQQMAGRVSPTTNINGMPVNDNAALEHEADVMGEKAVQCKKDCGTSLKNVNAMSDLVQCAGHVEPIKNGKFFEASYGKAAKERNGKCGVPGSLYKENLPHIAFETMAGENRIEELEDLYNNVIFYYHGAASIYMGVNACANYFCKEGENIWILKGENRDNGKLSDCAIPSHIKPYHFVKIVPFQWNLVGLDGKQSPLFTTDDGAKLLRQGKVPNPLSDEKKEGYDKEVSLYTKASDYIFPFFEARSLLMDSAIISNAEWFRWIDSDVKSDTSIEKLNESRFSQSKNEDKIPLIISGFYNWYRVKNLNDVFSNKFSFDEKTKMSYNGWGDFLENRYEKIVELMNEYEICLRKYYFTLKGGNLNTRIGDGQLDFYLPEPTLYMNQSAHNAALTALKKSVKENSLEMQSREAEVVVKNMRAENLSFDDSFMVEKPLKKEFDVNGYSKELELIAGINGAKLSENGDVQKLYVGKPICKFDEFKEKIKSVRQSAFGSWGGDGDFREKKEELLQEMFGRWIEYLEESQSSIVELVGKDQNFSKDRNKLFGDCAIKEGENAFIDFGVEKEKLVKNFNTEENVLIINKWINEAKENEKKLDEICGLSAFNNGQIARFLNVMIDGAMSIDDICKYTAFSKERVVCIMSESGRPVDEICRFTSFDKKQIVCIMSEERMSIGKICRFTTFDIIDVVCIMSEKGFSIDKICGYTALSKERIACLMIDAEKKIKDVCDLCSREVCCKVLLERGFSSQMVCDLTSKNNSDRTYLEYVATSMINAGMSIDKICEYTALSKERIALIMVNAGKPIGEICNCTAFSKERVARIMIDAGKKIKDVCNLCTTEECRKVLFYWKHSVQMVCDITSEKNSNQSYQEYMSALRKKWHSTSQPPQPQQGLPPTPGG